MSDPFLAEIRAFPFIFAPAGWAFCNGQLLPISQNTPLFSLLGTTYGGDGRATFGLPNLQGATLIHAGQGPGLTEHFLGEMAGTPTVTLLSTEMPMHNHALVASDVAGTMAPGPGAQLGRPAKGNIQSMNSGLMYSAGAANPQMSPQSLSPAGGNAAHNNMMPSLALNYCIALRGIFPPRS